ncbi:ketopantoate reductase family protein [Pseudomonas sp. CCI3.2]|uniref:ketopantoate reductase family protein n=1 Tax=unclassified Pseudomonas TaxID=196821 RepID=UPI002AC8DDA5|nr:MULTISPECIES: ketopantoate reductase family protein [unclassified Pseudomonas]MEB0079966.1 ketopantoate reductase family protein [Pseudomonas sp. MH10out]MEB0093983.1 ketopantoate reductase family protein [Pseudomonas sp. CCI4.2]MEB0102440.1 ketopantoate reductase family protein [Pseudomonas sp. CCI3.2]MEB0133103.1 ketopantoate reductase family protein [Pseudomonas sp. CCI2.4]MEB0160284.1 ketopantoate reductase family protein [Pseudomonas sp. AH2 (2023)]
MRILIVGAGAIGGYFGGRLLEAARDVTFLVRPGRAQELDRDGLVVRSPLGNIDYPAPPHIASQELNGPYDLILLSCKAYDLDAAMDSFAAAVGPDTAILPLLNGMAHVDRLAARFSKVNVLGGQCLISVDRDASGTIVHLNDTHQLTFGELDGQSTARAQQIASALSGAGFEAKLSLSIVQEMWEKWCFIATGAGITGSMRSAIGDVLIAGGECLILRLLEECAQVADKAGYPIRPEVHQRFVKMLTLPGSKMTASMLRDVERGAAIEVEHVLGDLVARRDAEALGTADLSVLGFAYTHLKAYEARRLRG